MFPKRSCVDTPQATPALMAHGVRGVDAPTDNAVATACSTADATCPAGDGSAWRASAVESSTKATGSYDIVRCQ